MGFFLDLEEASFDSAAELATANPSLSPSVYPVGLPLDASSQNILLLLGEA